MKKVNTYISENTWKLNFMRQLVISSLIMGMFFLYACNAFFEKDIENEVVVIQAPVNGASTDIVSQCILWDELEGANFFRLQIVTPDFGSAGAVIADTLITGTQFLITLYPGQFEWRIRGENSAYKTQWTKASFTIFATEDLTRQQIRITSPIDNYNTKDSIITLKWDKLYNATSYQVIAYKNVWDNEQAMEPQNVTSVQTNIALPEGTFIWGIKAINDISESPYAKREIIVDRTPPTKPVLKVPANKASLSDTTVTFSWISSDVVNTYVSDILFVYSDKELSILIKEVVTITPETTIALPLGNTYYWRIRSSDKAGNLSSYSSVFEFTLVGE